MKRLLLCIICMLLLAGPALAKWGDVSHSGYPTVASHVFVQKIVGWMKAEDVTFQVSCADSDWYQPGNAYFMTQEEFGTLWWITKREVMLCDEYSVALPWDCDTGVCSADFYLWEGTRRLRIVFVEDSRMIIFKPIKAPSPKPQGSQQSKTARQ